MQFTVPLLVPRGRTLSQSAVICRRHIASASYQFAKIKYSSSQSGNGFDKCGGAIWASRRRLMDRGAMNTRQRIYVNFC